MMCWVGGKRFHTSFQ
ncbi:hypothetical protein LINPERPRIM_LOCUS40913 [Linum perenne]